MTLTLLPDKSCAIDHSMYILNNKIPNFVACIRIICSMDFQIHYYRELTSTNEKLNELIHSEDVPEGTVIQAGYQTHGKGHAGAIWQSEPGKNLLFSILLKPFFLPPGLQFDLSRIISLAIRDLISDHLQGATIKWPNDLYAGDRKIGGILIENTLQGNDILNSVAGAGLNVNQEDFDLEIPLPTSLYLEKQCHFDIQVLLGDLLVFLGKWYGILKSGRRELICQSYLENLYRYGTWTDFRVGGQIFPGKILDVLPDGELFLERKNGKKENFGFKGIEFVL